MKGHIQLGVAGDLRDYLMIDPMQYHASPANPMAPRLNTGEKFAELTGWAEWVQQDWPGGVGRQEPADNGYLYGDLDSRVSGQLILPPAIGATIGYPVETGTEKKNRGLFMPTDATGYTTVTLTAAGVYAMNTYAYALAGQISRSVRIFARQSAGGSARIRLYTSEYVTEAFLSGDGAPAFAWRGVTWDSPYTFVASGNVAITISVISGTLEIACGYGYPNYATGTFDTAWTEQTYAPLLVADWYATADGIENYYSFVRNANRLQAVAEQDNGAHTLYLAGYNVDSNTFGLASTYTLRSTDLTVSATTSYNGILSVASGVTITVTDTGVLEITDQLTAIAVTDEDTFQAAPAVQFDGYTYLPVGDGFGMIAANGNGTTETPDASLFTAWAGYLWRATGNDVYYSADGAAWTGPITIGGDDYRVRGMMGADRTVYVATDEGLFYVGDGDIVIGITPWGTLVDHEVRGVNYEGALCLPVAGRVLRYSLDGSLLDVWVQRADDLPADKLGAPTLLTGMNQWLLAAIDSTAETQAATVWAWQTEGWHPIASLPPGVAIRALYYDRTLSRLWIGCDHGLVFWLRIDDYALNPYNSPDSRFMPYGWLETPRFYGDLKKVDKDFESVFVTGEFPTGTSVAIYYQSDQDSDWALLGTVTADNTELRFSDYATRPTGKWIKLGVVMATTDPTKTAKVKAIVLKYMPMTMDRERWQLPILIAQEQEMVDGTQDVQTQAQKLAHVRSLITRVAPFTLVDMDGQQYQVKVVGANRSVYQYAPRIGAGDSVIDWIVTLSLEQVY
jgi:hypothetical protein